MYYFFYGFNRSAAFSVICREPASWPASRPIPTAAATAHLHPPGCGDISPLRQALPVAALEGFFGAFTMALFVTLFTKSMAR